MDARAKDAAPGKLKTEKQFIDFETALENHLSILRGSLGVPLSYVIRDESDPEDDGDVTYATFDEECVAKCPLQGPHFEADARQVHQIITSFTTGETSEQWIKPLRRFQNGRRDFRALRDHYKGEGNITRTIAEAERLRDSLHYKSEAALSFSTFLAKTQHMFNLFEQNQEPYLESQKLRFLLDKVKAPELQNTVEAVKSSMALDANAYSFTTAANHLSAQIEVRPVGRALSEVNTDDIPQEILKDGKINTGHYSNWKQLSQKSRDMIIAERKRLGVPGRKQRGKGNDAEPGGRKIKALANHVKSLTKTVKKQTATIASLRQGCDDDDSSDSSGSDAAPMANAGNAFGGWTKKAAKRKKQKPNA